MTAAVPSPDRSTGCLLGLALGDVLGAPWEGGLVERWVWRLIGRTRTGARRYTDDTRMALDLAGSLLACGGLDQADLAARFAASYHFSRGYGPGAARLLRRIRAGLPWREASRSVYPEGSFGNGGAMRAPVLALWFWPDRAALIAAARQSAEITHAHPLGQEGAVLIAIATAETLAGESRAAVLESVAQCALADAYQRRIAQARKWLVESAEVAPAQVCAVLGTGITAPQSCISALYLALRFRDLPYLDMVHFVRACGGDVDTVGAMAGALWGAARGAAALPQAELAAVEDIDLLRSTAAALHAAAAAAAGAATPGPPPESGRR